MKQHKNNTISLMNRFLEWRQNHVSEKQFILVLSFMVGICTAFAALLLKGLIHPLIPTYSQCTKYKYIQKKYKIHKYF